MRIHTPVEIGLLVRDARKAEGWSQSRLAEAVGATRQWVRALESGKARLELGLTLRALNALGISLDVTPPVPRRSPRSSDEATGEDASTPPRARGARAAHTVRARR